MGILVISLSREQFTSVNMFACVPHMMAFSSGYSVLKRYEVPSPIHDALRVQFLEEKNRN